MRLRSGQAMVEYALAFAAMVVVVTVLGHLVTAAYRSSERNSQLVRSDYP